ncbi:MAG: Crp/Fnr family transcriptional regulator [Kiloniellales bacterium]|nr:Crp/Fnr family transcriptional regulator [Kiloniellales bacterium]
METSGAALRTISIFREVAEGDLDVIAKRCQWRRFSRDQQILGYGDDSNDVFFVVMGRVRAINYSIAGKEVSFRDIEAGDMFGEFAAIDGQPRSANVVALSDTMLAAMSANVFWDAVLGHPEVTRATMKRLTAQVRSLTERVFEFSTLAVKNRIHAELLRLARDHMDEENVAVIAPAPKHADIASRLSTHREAVTRELNELAHSGLLERRERNLVITDVAQLKHMVEEVLGERPRG